MDIQHIKPIRTLHSMYYLLLPTVDCQLPTADLQPRLPVSTSSLTGGSAVSRRPVLSVRKRIINSPAAAHESTVTATTTSQVAELATTSKYNRLRGRLTAAPTTTPTITPHTYSNNISSSKNYNYLGKLKTKSTATVSVTASVATSAAEPATSTSLSPASVSSANDITQKQQNKFQPASYALRRQFQTRRLTTTSSSIDASDESEPPRTQNPLFKRRSTLNTTPVPPRTSTIETTTNLYAIENGDGLEDANDQVAKSSIHTSRFNHIPKQAKEQQSGSAPTVAAAVFSTRRQLIPRPRRPQPSLPTATPPNRQSQRQPLQSRRRPHKYIEIYSRPPTKPAIATATATSGSKQQALDYEYYDDGHTSISPPLRSQEQQQHQLKVIVQNGIIECLQQGNFPHPLSCRKFISCAKFEENGGIVGWEYTCPKGLSYDSIGGICTFATGQACRD